MASIFVLDEFTANQIAAGEVVERPVSVIKELVENSLDAGAGKITVNIADGGLSSIKVSDNGCGMEEDDVLPAFQRHATSKIKNAADLRSITTLGFRGEALPSISAVSRVVIRTRPADVVSGTRAEIRGGTLISTGPAGCPAGTSIEVYDLFYNTPARRKTMKSAAVESSLCGDLVSRLALARPDVSFELSVKGGRTFHSPGTGRLIDSVAAVYGTGQTKEMVPVKASVANIGLKGYAGKPSFSRSNRNYQTVIINGRYVRCPAVAAAVEEAYRTLLPAGRRPVVVLSFKIAPDLLDVNVHPAKLEVRLLEEEKIAEITINALREALYERKIIPVIKREHRVIRTGEPPAGKEDAVRVTAGLRAETVPETKIFNHTPAFSRPGRNADLEQAGNRVITAGEKLPEYECRPAVRFPELIPLAQLLPNYILARGEDGLYIIDQHAAHERILYEEFRSGAEKNGRISQSLLMPVTLDLDYREAGILTERIVWFSDAGFVVEHFGGNTFLLRGVPPYFPPGREKEFFTDMLNYFGQLSPALRQNDFFEKVASSLACREAIKAGEKLSTEAAAGLIRRLAATENPFTCPHGRPTIVHISNRELDSRFKR
ncbi:MAG: DNA mismatch repair endonuclease MutL [Firmicutes bacterium]|nr:DNA mismatch repair endonuclease MutL [Bacillota bacterium]